MDFRFKQFNIKQDKTALKVGTDSVILGSYANYKKSENILDIGTGTGILALMAAQKSDAIIDAVEIDKNSYNQSLDNFHNSKWYHRINGFHTSIQEFTMSCQKKYDTIISNPPYFSNSTKSANSAKITARHTDSLSYKNLCESVSSLLNESGKFYLILPFEKYSEFRWIAFDYNLFCESALLIKPSVNKETNLIVMRFGRFIKETEKEILTIRDKTGEYTEEFKKFTEEFYL